jgi:hypothetical protein
VALLCLLGGSWPLGAISQTSSPPSITWKEDLFNPKPENDDLVLPMDCGGAMVFRPVEIPSGSWLDDRRVELGHADEKRGYKEGRRLSYLAGAFSVGDGRRVYYIAKYETTRDQYTVIAGGECPTPSMRGRLPATDMSWFDALQFTRRYTEWLLQHAREQLPFEGQEPGFLRLPTDEEWEFAARGGLKVDEADFLAPLFPMPEGDLALYAWHESTQSAEGKLRPVGLLKANPLDLFDILGNASEMTFAPFYLDHRGRAHGQAGGFVTRGGDIFTPPSQIGAAVRQEHNYFSAATGNAKSIESLGFRPVLSAPVIVSPERLVEIQQAWAVLPSLLGDVGAEAEQALNELHDLALRSQDQNLRSKLELIQRNVEQAHAEINEARGRTMRALIGTGTFLAKRVVTDGKRADAIRKLMNLAVEQFNRLAGASDGSPNHERLVSEARAALDARMAKWREQLADVEQSAGNTLSYYGDMVISVGRDYSDDEILRNLQLVEEELRIKRNDYLVPYAERFGEHVVAYRRSGDAIKSDWFRELITIEAEESP